MSENSQQPPGRSEPSDPWAPPAGGVPLDKPAAPQDSRPPQAPQQPASVHDMPTVLGMPSAGPGPVPPPPTAPGGPAQPTPGPYGYPAVPPVQQQPPAAQQPAAPYGALPPYGAAPGAAYGYPGYPATGYPGYGQPGWQQPPANGMGVAALVLGIIGVVGFCMWGLGVILGVLALIFGIIGRRRAHRGEATNGGMALAGIILGAIGMAIGAAFLGLLIWGIANGGSSGDSTSEDPFATSLVVGADR
ncbi:DUF4190 domain-containing protein [Streptomyces sp. NPDC088400]|uniref:DUF4190 domain-containing protein n=1 Tax=Streptomyces sp. NPDC088400 TaxID=3365861 RepID=UPI003809C005